MKTLAVAVALLLAGGCAAPLTTLAPDEDRPKILRVIPRRSDRERCEERGAFYRFYNGAWHCFASEPRPGS